MTTTPTVAFLGPSGTFSEQAARNHFDSGWQPLPCATIEDVFQALEDGRASHGIVPVENSTEGVVNNTQDCMLSTSARIVAEEVVAIEHQLLVSAATQAQGIGQIASHAQSLAQCRRWLQSQHPELPLRECRSNAEAAALARDEVGTAAIAGRLAAEAYGLQTAATGIQDQQHNSTRFLVFAEGETRPSGSDKTTALIYTANRPGALFHVLEPFNALQVSLTKIDSRPAKRAAWEYVFFVDFEGHLQDERIRELFTRLESCTEEIKVLGSYPAAGQVRD